MPSKDRKFDSNDLPCDICICGDECSSMPIPWCRLDSLSAGNIYAAKKTSTQCISFLTNGKSFQNLGDDLLC